MATAHKLPSGSWRCLVFSHFEYVDGKKKRRYESFTASTKREAEMLAATWSYDRKRRPEDITIGKALDQYIDAKRGVLSPSTIVGYNTCRKRFEPIANIKLRDVKTSNIQPWVSEMSARLSQKTVQNTFGLLTAVLDYYSPGASVKIKLPPKEKKFYDLPSDNDIQTLLEYSNGTELWTAIMLARYYSLRRSEICALEPSDLVGNVLTIHRATVLDENGVYVTKEIPKTYGSFRYVIIADPLLSALQAGQFVHYHPGTLSDRFKSALKASGVKPFNFHLLRHMFATKAAMNGIPDFFTAQIGGWEQNSTVLKGIYQNVRDNDLREKMREMNLLMQQEMQHEKEKSPE